MKHSCLRTLLIFVLALVPVVSATSATITGTVQDASENAIPGAIVKFVSDDTPLASTSAVIANTVKTKRASATGTFSIVLAEGDYFVTIGSPNFSEFWIAVPEGSGTHDWLDLVTTISVYTGSQTPWAQDIDAAGYDLTRAGFLSVSNAITAHGTEQIAGMYIVSTNFGFNFQTNWLQPAAIGLVIAGTDGELALVGNDAEGGHPNAFDFVSIDVSDGSIKTKTTIAQLSLASGGGLEFVTGTDSDLSVNAATGGYLQVINNNIPLQVIQQANAFGIRWTRDSYDAVEWRLGDSGYELLNTTDSRKDIYIDGDGNVGLGNNVSPATVLDVTGTVTATQFSGGGASVTGVDDDNVVFDDANSDFTATAIGPAVEELVSVNGSGVNSATAKVDWTQLGNVPAGFADGTDDGAGGSGDSISIDSSAVVDPDFVSTGDIDFVDTSNTVTANINAGAVVNADINASAAIVQSKIVDPALGTDTTGNYAAGDGEAGASLSGDSATSYFPSGTIEDARLPTAMASKTLTGQTTLTGSTIKADTAIGALEINVLVPWSTKSLTGANTLTFSATPTAGTMFTVELTESSSADSTITIPSSKSIVAGTITTFILRADTIAVVTWRYDGTDWNIYGDPFTIDDLAVEASPASGDFFEMWDSVSNIHKKVDVDNLPAGSIATDAVGTVELDDDANTPTAGYAVIVEAGATSFDYLDLSAVYQPLEATLTDIADGTIAENLVNTANPWAANEITEADPTVDTEAEIEAITGALFGASKAVTSGNVWVADGVDFESVAMSGDAAIATGGAVTVAATIARLASPTFTGTVVFPSGQALIAPVLGTIASGVATALTALNGENIQDNTIDEDSIDWGTGTDQVSAVDVPIADAGSYFTATEVEAALQEVAVEALTESETFTIMEPDSVQAVSDIVLLKHFPAERYPNGVTMVSIHVGASAAYTSEAFNFEESASPTGSTPSTIEAITLTSASNEDDGTFTDGDIAADGYIFVDLDDTPEDVAFVSITLAYTID